MTLSYRLPERLRVSDHDFISTSARVSPLADSQGLRRGGLRSALRHRIVLAYVWNQMFRQISSINSITYHAATIYETAIGMDGLLSRILAACNGTEYFLASLIPIFVIEKMGRRMLMLVGAAGIVNHQSGPCYL